MPAIFIKIEEYFTLLNSDVHNPDQKTIIQQYNEEGTKDFGLSIINNELDIRNVGFTFNQSEILSGQIEIVESGDNLDIKIDAVFKISPRPAYYEAVMDPETKWELSKIANVGGWKIDGLESETFTRNCRVWGSDDIKVVEEIKYFVNVKVAQKKKDL